MNIDYRDVLSAILGTMIMSFWVWFFYEIGWFDKAIAQRKEILERQEQCWTEYKSEQVGDESQTVTWKAAGCRND